MTEKWVRDTGLVLALISLFFAYRGSNAAFFITTGLVIAVLFAPSVLRPLAYLWLKLTHILGFFVNKIFFGIVFFSVVTPVGLMRKIFNRDPLRLQFKSTGESAFTTREVVFTSKDMQYPF